MWAPICDIYSPNAERDEENKYEELAGACGEIYLKVSVDTGVVIGATTRWSMAYAWFHDEEVYITVWCDVAHMTIDNEELLDIYGQFGFWYALDHPSNTFCRRESI